MKKILILLPSLVMAMGLAGQNTTTQSEILNNLKNSLVSAADQSATAAQQAVKASANQAVQSASGAVQSAAANAVSGVSDSGLATTISSFVKSLTGTTLSAKNIAGTWKYVQPAVQFESENLLASAGGVLAAQTIETKLNTLFVKAGVRAGVLKFTFAADGTFTSSLGAKTFKGKYTLDSNKNTIKLTYYSALMTEIATLNADVKLTSTNMSLLFDADKLLKWFTVIARATNNANLKSIGTLAGNYRGMKVGFEFNK